MHDGRIAFWTYGSQQKISNLERDPRISCLVETGTDYFELRGVSIKGTAEIVRDHDRIREIGSARGHPDGRRRLVRGPRRASADEVERQVQKRVAIVVTPTRSPAGTTARWSTP